MQYTLMRQSGARRLVTSYGVVKRHPLLGTLGDASEMAYHYCSDLRGL